ncbi:MAG TPA: patatin-like phospholipase family protein [Stellaceae bacterium]|nr:patatin-like phospholipase family protein [Stellaceae bacterium]
MAAGDPRNLFSVLSEEYEALHPGRPPVRDIDALYRALHEIADNDAPRAALCLSGGGIRSASFALGVIQALQRHGLLFKFHYLSSVSGGGYVAAWLAAWRAHAGNDTTVAGGLAAAHEPPEVKQLRAGSNYLTPKTGLFSADTWAAVAQIVRNIILNWLIFLPLFLAVVLLPIVSAEFIGWVPLWKPFNAWAFLAIAGFLLVLGLAGPLVNQRRRTIPWMTQGAFIRQVLAPLYIAATLLAAVADFAPFAVPAWSLRTFLPWLVGAGTVLYAASWWLAFALSGFPFRRFRREMALFLCWTISGAVAGAILALVYHLFVSQVGGDISQSNTAKNLLVVIGVSLVVFAVEIAETIYVGLSSRVQDSTDEREWRGRSSGWLAAVTAIWTILAAIVLFGPVALASGWSLAAAAVGGTVTGLISALFGASAKSAATEARQIFKKIGLNATISVATLVFLVLFAALLARAAVFVIDWVELFDPLRRCIFAAVALIGCAAFALLVALFINVNRFSLHALYRNRIVRAYLGAARAPAIRHPDPFTGFDPADDLPAAAVWSVAWNRDRRVLFPVYNMALNLVGTDNLAWQERKAESFAVTPLSAGSERTGYRSTEVYGGRPRGIRLGTAVAISGAAASPNEGYYSSPLVGLLMMLANVRLGWWLGNPRYARASRTGGPPFGFWQMLMEIFGLTTDDRSYIYLSDGGHFENLGVYEMIRRRCRYIVVSDAGSDPECRLEDLGNAVRKVWIDLGVSIRFRAIDVSARVSPAAPGVYCAIADICYPECPDRPGRLLYLKPGYHGTEPADVRAYAALHPDFPHESTANQWFTESQLESYRILANHVVDLVCRGGQAPTRRMTAACTADDQDLSLRELFGQGEAYLATRAAARP